MTRSGREGPLLANMFELIIIIRSYTKNHLMDVVYRRQV
jgi:hypothetical protein